MGIASLRAHAADLCVLTKAPPLTAADNDSSFISTQIPIGALASPGNTPSVNMTIFGDPILWNTTFQCHFMEYVWPEREVNYEYWPNGEHVGLSQVLLTPVSTRTTSRLEMSMPSPRSSVTSRGTVVCP
jgi:hypothetical protein